MKALYFFLPALFFFLVSCDKEDAELPNGTDITNVAFLTASSVQEPQEIEVTISKPTPCHQITKVEKTVNEDVFDYNFIIPELDENTVCAQVIAEETRTVIFDPSASGEFTLNFYINGKFNERRTITVTE